ncbi:MAG: hypothetical protein U0T32_05180 [Chitinophagales bacterium]
MRAVQLLLLFFCANTFAQKQTTIYTTTKDDNLKTITTLFSVSEKELQQLNPGLFLDAILPNLKLVVPSLPQHSVKQTTSVVNLPPTDVQQIQMNSENIDKTTFKFDSTRQMKNIKPIEKTNREVEPYKLAKSSDVIVEFEGKLIKIAKDNISSFQYDGRSFICTSASEKRKQLAQLAQNDPNIVIIDNEDNITKWISNTQYLEASTRQVGNTPQQNIAKDTEDELDRLVNLLKGLGESNSSKMSVEITFMDGRQLTVSYSKDQQKNWPLFANQ